MAEIQPYTSIAFVMRYAKSCFERKKREEAYRFYISEVLRVVSENTAKMGGGRTINMNYFEFMEKAEKPADNRTGDEIAQDVIKMCGIIME